MTNPQLGFEELAAAQAQPHIPLNAALRITTAALGGEKVVNFTGDADHVLLATPTASGGVSPNDEWPYRVIRMTDTGALLTAARSVIYPDVDTLYGGPSRLDFFFRNETAHPLTIKRSGQTGVLVQPGAEAFVRHNGTDIVAIVNPLP